MGQMTIRFDNTGVYRVHSNADRSYIYPIRIVDRFSKKTVYDFDPKSGVLKISISPGDLEILLQQLGGIPDSGRDLILPSPNPVDGTASTLNFTGVKHAVPITEEDERNYYIRLQKPGEPIGLIRRFFTRDHFGL